MYPSWSSIFPGGTQSTASAALYRTGQVMWIGHLTLMHPGHLLLEIFIKGDTGADLELLRGTIFLEVRNHLGILHKEFEIVNGQKDVWVTSATCCWIS